MNNTALNHDQEFERTELIKELASEVEGRIEAYNESYYLDPNGDYVGEMASLLGDEFNGQNLRRCLQAYADDYRTEDKHPDLEELLKLSDEVLDEVAGELWHMDQYETRVEHLLKSSEPMTIATISYGEQEEEIEYYLDGIDAEYHDEIREYLTGYADDKYYYINNEYSFVALVIDVNDVAEVVSDFIFSRD